ncbi:MAG TPA: DUF6580 family putative transport protein [Gemmataceae bacterium]|nr:DUF6580 family putative transport protein [Gemmataceae bacterium]
MSSEKHTNQAGPTWPWVFAFAALAVLHRLLPRLLHLGPEAQIVWNFVPVGALGLFAGARWHSRFAVLTPLAVMLGSDLLMWPLLAAQGYSTFSWGTPIIYASFTVYALIGRLMRPTSSVVWITAAPFAGSVQFFLASNFLCWPGNPIYPQNLSGLMQCYIAGVPFFPNTLGADLLFSFLFFGLYALGQSVIQRQKASQPA